MSDLNIFLIINILIARYNLYLIHFTTAQHECELLAKHLEAARAEARVAREEVERSRREALFTGSNRFEVDAHRSEVLRLTQLVESLGRELETANKRIAEVHTSPQSY